ncbi:intermembrane transport protein PqiB [uncultured Tateyamaria sp.]|uniref:PqiB family protein n=1 Tax=uncultured Tateyamaria sp. TaxID=455651 RepID=UPI0026337932|nr:MlaD family protein [uncultured Tateyamaria sp.]
MPNEVPEIDVKPARRPFLQRMSVVWLVPIVGLVVALSVAWQTWSSQGPRIVIVFEEASGVKANETELRYRDVVVGRVEQVEFSPDLGRVEVSVRLDKEIAPFVDADAVFWVVRPQVSTRGVSGLDTVLSGVFIEGVWDTNAMGFAAEHVGLATAPLLRPGEEGTTITLRAQPGTTLAEGTAITYKGIEVGRVGSPELQPNAAQANAPAVIYAPYDRLISSTTRFWDTSGFSFSIGAGGANLDFTSLASLVAGGIAFDTLVSGGVPPSGTPLFDVYASEPEARTALFDERRGNVINLSMVFDDNATGLAVGSPVYLNGISIGEVTNVSGLVDPLRFRDERVRLQVSVEVAAAPLGLSATTSDDVIMDFFAAQVEAGLRARLTTASILTGGLRIELVTVDGAERQTIDFGALPLPAIPTTDSQIADAGATAQGVLQRINDLPIEELMQSAVDFLNATTALVNDGDLAKIPQDVRKALGDVIQLTSSADVQAVPERIAAILSDAEQAIAELAGILRSFQSADTVERVLATVDATGAAAETISDSVEGVPELVESLTATARTAQQLPLEDLVTRLSQVVASTDELLNTDGTQDLPATLNASLDEIRLALSELREGGAVANLNATLASTQNAAETAAQAAQSLPELVNRLNTTLDRAEDTLAGYDESSEFNRTVRLALTEVARAAKAVTSLSRTIERQPNSLLLGR